MKNLALLFILTIPFMAFSQKKVMLHSNGVATPFGGSQPFIDAYNAAIDGDTIYLHGGQLISPTGIDKKLTIFGSGHHPDFVPVTGQTIIPNSLSIFSNSAGSHLEGLFINGGITFFGKVDSVTIKRCRVNGISLNGIAGDESDGIVITENIISGGLNGQLTKNLVVKNNIIKNFSHSILINLANNAWFSNNIIMGRGYSTTTSSLFILNNITECYFENNIFYNLSGSSSLYFSNVVNNTFVNNVFGTSEPSSANIWINNYWNTQAPDILVNFLGNSFSYDEDYNLINPLDFPGTTGNEVGIYGGLNPAKPGAIPTNPHFLIKNVATQTNTNGELEIEISVEAQNE